MMRLSSFLAFGVALSQSLFPPSPHEKAECFDPAKHGYGLKGSKDPLFVKGFPAPQKLIYPFSDNYKEPVDLVRKDKICRADGHCMYTFEIDVYETQIRAFDNAVPKCKNFTTGTWWITYNGQAPGPTIRMPTGHESLVRFNNKINQTHFKQTYHPCADSGRSGRPIAIHHHGSASLAPWDGWAEDSTCYAETKDYYFPNNRPATEWYHDHALHVTADNAYLGMAGMYVVSSRKKDGGCGVPWNLEDVEEKIMIIQDKLLDRTCQLEMDATGYHKNDFYGDINLVNGIPFPNQQLAAKPYRFRFLNGAVSRPFRLQIRDETGKLNLGHKLCSMIGSDGGYRHSAPIEFPKKGLLLGVAERWEVYCDFTSQAGKTLYWWNDKDEVQMDKVPMFCHSHLISKMIVGAKPAGVVQKLNPSLPVPYTASHMDRVLSAKDIEKAIKMANEGKYHRKFHFKRANGMWTINGETWDTVKIAAKHVGHNTWELWKMKTGGGWFHPIHVHLIDFFVLKRDGAYGLETFEQTSPKDVLYLGPGNEVYMIARFGAHKGDYMFHCHNLIHEDNDMMRAFRVSHTMNGDNSASAVNTPYILNPLFNITYGNYRYADPMLGELAARPTKLVDPLWTAANRTLGLNVYRIFYPQCDDLSNYYRNSTNPWVSEWCPAP